ncbi:gamma carbonic anhydrase family protein [Myxococcota bacterium]|nr:gamma carbonic anhydrase family protein [Myxococcota bacterium]
MQMIDESVYRSPTAQIYGRVQIGTGSSVWPNAVIRSEAQEVVIGRYTNIQDFVMIHVGYEAPTRVGDLCSIAHHATLHGCTVGDQCMIGINATVMDGAVIGAGSIVGGGALVTEGSEFPERSIIAGIPARRIKERDSSRANRINAWQYYRNAQAYRAGDHRAWTGPEYQKWLAKLRKDVAEDLDLKRLQEPRPESQPSDR